MMEENVLLLKKYNNRRLYDTEKSIYVTLDYVTDVVKKGRKIKVTDAKTGEDVTSAILTQIVLEEARKKKYLLPPPLLYLIIQYGENVLPDFFEKYLEQTIKNYLMYRGLADDQFKKWLEYGDNLSKINPQAAAGLSSFKPIFDMFAPPVKDDKKESGKS
ncbi:MAG: polyhydroxyalkanoate synthesis regulator DNA-binding domain-containing protein [Smithella sp.]|nr:polyhydroxyalkanoate synthesis regulator DNA-binding domain-containing protein [Smithella sp.]